MFGLGYHCSSSYEESAVLFALVATLVIGQEAVKNPQSRIGCEDLGTWAVYMDKRSFHDMVWITLSVMSTDL